MSDSLEARLVATLAQAGPLTGEVLMRRFGEDTLEIWRECRRNPRFEMRSVASHYLRLDERLDGWARLSPSVAREFLTFTVISLTEQRDAAEAFATSLRATTTTVGREKLELAHSSVLEVQRRCELSPATPVIFMIAGDVTYDMAHRAPRPEMNTGELVAGSDIDIVVIHGDDVSPDVVAQVESELIGIKWRLLRKPREKEELDFVVKPLAKTVAQLAGRSFHESLASKVLVEARLLGGDEQLAHAVSAAIEASGAAARMREFEARAHVARTAAEARLERAEELEDGDLTIFHPAEEFAWE